MRSLLLCLLALPALASAAYHITKQSPEKVQRLKQGDSVTLSCTAYDYWEWCTMRHVPTGRICDIDWRKPEWNVSVLNCGAFQGRYEYVGDYDKYNCAVRFTDLRGEDAGQWECDMEKYWNGRGEGRGKGEKV